MLKNTKKIISLCFILAGFLFPAVAFAQVFKSGQIITPTGITVPKGVIMSNGDARVPLTASSSPMIHFLTVTKVTATSTTQSSTFPYASTTAISVSSLTSGNCVQASTGGLLTTTSLPCGSGSGGGTDGNWVYFNGSGIRLATTTNAVIINKSATSTGGSSLEVSGVVSANAFTSLPPITSGLILYTNPSSGYKYRSGGSNQITQWNDISGNGNNLFQTNALADTNHAPRVFPSPNTDALNTGAGFSQTISSPFNYYFQIPTSVANNSNSMSVFIVAKPEYNNRQMFLYTAGQGTTFSYPAIASSLGYNNTGAVGNPGSVALWTGTTASTYQPIYSYSKASTQFFGFTSGTASTTMYHDFERFPVSHLTATTSVGGYIGVNDLTKSATYDAFAGQIYEVLIYNRQLGDNEVVALREWMARKYGWFNQTTVNVITAGDSITEGYGASDGDNVYPNMLAQNKNYNVVNAGISGIFASSWAPPGGYAELDALPKYTIGAQNIVIMEVGTNDIQAGATAAQTLTSLRSLGTQLRNAGFKTAFMTILPRGSFSGAQETIRQTVNATMKTYGDAYWDYLIDPNTNVAFSNIGSTADTNYYQSDTVHLTSAGLQILASLVENAVNLLMNPNTAGGFGIGTTTSSTSFFHEYMNASTTYLNAYTISSSTAAGTKTTNFNISNTGDVTALGEFTSQSGTASVFPYASTTALTVSGALYNSGLSNGCLNVTSGLIGSTGSACGAGGGSSSEINFTYGTPRNLVYMSTTSNQFSVGANSTSTLSYPLSKFLVLGDTSFNGNSTTTGVLNSDTKIVAPFFTSTSTTVASSFPYASTTVTSFLEGFEIAQNGNFSSGKIACRWISPYLGCFRNGLLIWGYNTSSGNGMFGPGFSGGDVQLFTYPSGSTAVVALTVEGANSATNGFIGIGSTTPAYNLSVEGSSSLGNFARAGYFTSTSTTIASQFPYASTTAVSISSLATPAGKFLAIDPTGLVIGTTTPSGGTGTPGGANTYVQYNDSGVFGGDIKNTWNKTNQTLTITAKDNSDAIAIPTTGGTMHIRYSTSDTKNIIDSNSDTIVSAGYIDGNSFNLQLMAGSNIGYIQNGSTGGVGLAGALPTTGYQLVIGGTTKINGGLLATASSTINATTTITGQTQLQSYVGVGTTTPFSTLSVSTLAQQDVKIPLFTVASTTKTTLFTVMPTGNVGIGTASPVTPLDVVGRINVLQTAVTTALTVNGGSSGNLISSICRNQGGVGCVYFHAANSNPSWIIDSQSSTNGTTAQIGFNLVSSYSVGNETNYIRATRMGANGAGQLGFYTGDTSGNANLGLIVTTDGNTGLGTSTPNARLVVNGIYTSTSTPPTLSSCGTSPTVRGTSNWGEITTGATATGCTVTFSVPFPTFASCVVTNESASLVNAMSYTDSRTGFTVTQTGLGGSILDYRCDGY